MPASQPIAVFGDTLTITVALLVLRYVLLATQGDRGWARFAATWLRRIAIVAVLLFVLRLASIAVERPEVAKPVTALIIAFLSGGAAILMLDRIIARAITARGRRA